MTANEIIREIEAMPPQEREQVIAFLLRCEKDEKSVRCVDDQTANKASARILKKHAKLMRKLAS